MSTTTAGIDLQMHQVEATEWLRDHPRALMAHDTGLGKTVTAIAWVREVLQQAIRSGRGDGVVVWVTEANLLAQTEAEFRRFAPDVNVLSCTDRLYTNQSVPARAQFADKFGPSGPDVLFLTYGLVMEGKAATTPWRRFGKPELVVCDEIQAVKGAGKRFEGLLTLTKPSPRVLAMTATPMQNDVTELWPVLRTLHVPDLLPRTSFGRRYAVWDKGREIRLPGGRIRDIPPKPIGVVEGNLSELRRLLAQCMHRVTVADTKSRIPEWAPDSGPRWVALSQAQVASYEAASGAGGVGYVDRTQAGRAADGDSALVDEFMRLIGQGGEYAAEAKVIVYCGTLDVVAMLASRLHSAGIEYRSIEGKTNLNDRRVEIENFRQDPKVRVFIGSDVLEKGLNLQCARLLVSLDCTDNPMRERQREGRIRRIASPYTSVTHVTLLPDTRQVREKWGRLAAKERDVRRVLDFTHPALSRQEAHHPV